MMNECVAFYKDQARAGMSHQPWLAQLQQQACQQFTTLGFPTRHDEEWKYTSVQSFLKQRFVAPHELTRSDAPLFDTPISSHRVDIINGLLTTTPDLPSGVIVLPIMEAIATLPEKVSPYLGQILKSEHAFQAMNTAMFQHGLLIYIPPQVCIEQPLWIRHWQDQANQAIYQRHLVIADIGSQVQIIEDYCGQATTCYFTNTITEVHLAQAATLTHTKLQRESKLAYHVGHVAVQQNAKSQYHNHSISIGGQWVRSDITINLDAPHAQCLMNGIYVPGDGQHVDHHTLVNHTVPDCQSAQDYKGILKGQSRAVFNGRVIVAVNAQHTEAKQQNKNLLLSDKAEIDTKPQLEIFADDVVCTHGATVGQLDEDALFYLATRGLSSEEASRYLMQAFMTENLRLLPNETFATWVGHLINEQLG